MIRRSSLVVAVLLIAASCGGSDDAGPLDLEGYVSEINRIVDEFDTAAAEADLLQDLPRDGPIADAAVTYIAYEAGLEAMKTITPPEAVTTEHDRVVNRLTELQDVVGSYLEEASTKGEFSMDALNSDPTIISRLIAFDMACDDLGSILTEQGVTDLPDSCGLLEP